MSRGKILVVDDDPRWQNALRRFLEAEDYSVTLAASSDEAVAELESQSFHLVVVDIRLVDWDTENEEGLQILAKMGELGLDSITQKIVVTGHGTLERQRVALAKYGALDFIPKEGDEKTTGFDRHEFIRLVEEIFAKKVKMNPGLDIGFSDNLTLVELADRLPLSTSSKQKQDELTDLLYRLFYDMSSIVVSPLALGHGGGCVIEVEPYCVVRGRARPVIVKIHNRETIQREADNYDGYVHGFVGGDRHTDKERLCYTLRLGGIAYSLLGVSERFISFGEYYRTHDTSAVTATIQHLFQETCRHWYENRSHKRRRNLTGLYQEQLGFNQSNLEQSLHDCFGKWAGQKEIQFSTLDGSFPNPVYSPYVDSRSITLPVFTAITHGDLNACNVLVDSNGHTWLIDFYRTREGHILRDIIELETVVKFELLNIADLSLLYAFESALVAPSAFDQPFQFPASSGSAELSKALAAITTLRSIAHDVVRPESDMQEYYVGLFYQTLNVLRYYSLLHREPKARRQYVLLSASMLSRQAAVLVMRG